MTLAGKVVVVTGASMGIGEAIARQFASEGATVVLSSRDLARAEAARQRIGMLDQTMALACDVRSREELQQLLRSTLVSYGRIDVWVNNAGFGLLDSVEKLDVGECRRMFDTNLFGVIDAMQLVAPVMREQGTGCIINISSVAGHVAVPYMAAYCAAKSALNSIGKAARVELHGTGVNVLTVCPGYVKTDFAANAVRGTEYQRIGGAKQRGIPAERVAQAVVNGYKRNKREIVVPARDWLVIWMYRLFPETLESLMRKAAKPVSKSPK
ncbi:MAG TPA: SDR family NAD(P)-dependent oxidoreductase [Clostridia bacterium]|nr:SDR family NAD(P)-dependent oxidoreductase [Clostridia bacterium]